MNYLKKVTLINFQSHINSVVEFDKSLNIIVGPSDSGKTAIIRGIKWALYNEPAGDFFIREGETEASVTLEFSNNIRIKRLRSKSKNAYILYNRDEDEIVFEGFGNKVPQEIIDLVGIKKIPLDTNETNAINLGEQLEGAFLLSEKGSTRASAIGRLIGVNLIDDALKDTIKDNRNISIKKNAIETNIKDIEEELVTYEYLDGLKEKIKLLESIRDNRRKKNELKSKLKVSLESYKKISLEKKDIENVLVQLKNVNIIENNIYNLEKFNKLLSQYKNIQRRIEENEKQIIYNENLKIILANNDIAEKMINSIENLKDKWLKLKRDELYLENYKSEIKKISKINNDLKHLDLIDDNAKNIQNKLNKLKKLISLKVKLESTYTSIRTGKEYLMKLEKINDIDVFISKLYINIEDLKVITRNNKKLNNIRLDIDKQEKSLITVKNDMTNNLMNYENLLVKNEVCPFCLSNINEDKIEHIIEHYS